MADHLLNDVPLISGNLDLPWQGAWTADVLLAGTVAPAVGSAAALFTAGTSRECTVVASSSDFLQCKVRLVAGKGKLYTEIPARDYRGYTAAQIAQDALQDAGEVAGDLSLLTAFCANWTRSQGPCVGALRRLVRLAAGELRWLVRDDGAVDVVDGATATSTLTDFDTLGSWGAERLLLLGMNDSTVVPGVAVAAFGAVRFVERVLYEWTPESFTAKCWYR